jgi:hypothetical protein
VLWGGERSPRQWISSERNTRRLEYLAINPMARNIPAIVHRGTVTSAESRQDRAVQVDAKLTQETRARIRTLLTIVKRPQVRDVRILRQVGRFQLSNDYALPNVADVMNGIDLR